MSDELKDKQIAHLYKVIEEENKINRDVSLAFDGAMRLISYYEEVDRRLTDICRQRGHMLNALSETVSRLHKTIVKLQARRDKWRTLHDSLGKTVLDLTECVQELEQANRWIPVTERLPEPWKECLCLTLYTFPPIRFGYYKKGEGWFVEVFGIDSHQPEEVTHWRPLPELPGESEAGE